MSQSTAPTLLENHPSGHWAQEFDPTPDWCRPGRQASQNVLFFHPCLNPRGHSAQISLAPLWLDHLPSAHPVQAWARAGLAAHRPGRHAWQSLMCDAAGTADHRPAAQATQPASSDTAPGSVPWYPLVHASHVLLLCADTALLHRPAGHAPHCILPSSAWNFPAAQSAHAVFTGAVACARVRERPAVQAMHAEAPDCGWYCPDPQLWHASSSMALRPRTQRAKRTGRRPGHLGRAARPAARRRRREPTKLLCLEPRGADASLPEAYVNA